MNVNNETILFNNYKNLEEIILNAPSKLNALDTEMSYLIYNKIKNWVSDKVKKENLIFYDKIDDNNTNINNNNINSKNIPKIVLLSGAGGKSFCSGGDINTLYKYRQ